MAAVHYSPIPTEIEDPVTYKEASALLARTGHPAAARTIANWVAQANQRALAGEREAIEVVRVRRTDYVSWSDVLDEHGDRTAAKLRCSSNWP